MAEEIDVRQAQFEDEVVKEAKELGLLPKDEEEDVPTGTKEEEVVTKTEKHTDREYTDLEKEQMKLGWDPNKPDGVSAKEYKRVGEIIEAKRAASKEVVELKQTVKKLVDYTRQIDTAAYKKAKAELDAERDEKIRLGELEAVKELNIKEKVLDAEHAATAIPVVEEEFVPVQRSEAIEAYAARNKFWIEGTTQEDRNMGILADTVIEYLKKTNPNISEADAIKAIEDEVKTKFPHRFDNPNKAQAPKVLKGNSSKSVSVDTDFSRDEQIAFMQVKKADPSITKDEFIKILELSGRRS